MIYSSAFSIMKNVMVYCPVGLRSFPSVVRFMRFISGRCSVHLQCIRYSTSILIFDSLQDRIEYRIEITE